MVKRWTTPARGAVLAGVAAVVGVVGPMLAVVELLRLKFSRPSEVSASGPEPTQGKKPVFLPPEIEPVPADLTQGPLVRHPYARLFAGLHNCAWAAMQPGAEHWRMLSYNVKGGDADAW